jgi:tRNA 2-selenouridine synthase
LTLTQDQRTRFPVLGPGELLERPPRAVIDLRSPAEFAEDHLPGAVNVPLFDDVQRALIGTLFVRESPERAFEEARAIVRQGVRALVAGISAATGWRPAADDLEQRVDALTSGGYAGLAGRLLAAETSPAPERAVVLHCWRGGLRSRSVLHLVRELGLREATLLAGGYKAWRAEVQRQLAEAALPRFHVLRGLTGVGKTLVLREIERAQPGSTLDLEALAGHRSSLLGMVGLAPCSQKMFESRLFARLCRGFPAIAFVEGESRKVGDVVLPARLWAGMQAGENVLLTASVERRVAVLEEDYLATPESRAELALQLPRVEARMPKKHVAGGLVPLLEAGRVDELVRLLLEHYYDPLYRHSEKGRSYAVTIDASDPARAARACLERAGFATGV